MNTCSGNGTYVLERLYYRPLWIRFSGSMGAVPCFSSKLTAAAGYWKLRHFEPDYSDGEVPNTWSQIGELTPKRLSGHLK